MSKVGSEYLYHFICRGKAAAVNSFAARLSILCISKACRRLNAPPA
jgi:hypothetical protein